MVSVIVSRAYLLDIISQVNRTEGGESVYGSADLLYILAWIVDSERTFNGSADPIITADRGFIQIMGPDFRFWLFGSSDCGSQRRPGKLTFSFLCTDVTQWRK